MQQDTFVLPDGLDLIDIVRPESVDGVADLLRHASLEETPVIPVGGGTSLGTGNHVDHPFLALDLRTLRGVREYEPTDLTASFWAGTSLAEVSDVLARNGQELPLDMPLPRQGTIGGLVATGFSGPRRLGSGTLKDLLIGCGYVRGDGLIAKAGGMLVKNVSGFEIPRLLHGSWGSLAVLTSINLKVVPQPKADMTLSQVYRTLGDALSAQMRLLEGHPSFFASVVERGKDRWLLHVRLLGRSGSLQHQMQVLRAVLGADADESHGNIFWQGFSDRWATAGTNVRLVIGTRPGAIAPLAEAVAAWSGVRGVAVSMPTGSLRLELDPDEISFAECRARLGESLRGASPDWVVESASAEWTSNGSIWGPDRSGMHLMRSIKQEFDPAGILNRGRLFI